ncbi:MAG: ABC transporter permease [Patescibacteria group bacterium]|nr:ABC transporter permease [Patescibacteria group bacterium]
MYKFLENIKLAIKAIWAKKTRSFLTMLGVIIGVFSIVLLIGIGQGVKSEVTGQIEDLGSNLLMVMPGSIGGGPLSSSGTFSEEDLEVIKKVEGIQYTVPMVVVPLPISSTPPTVPANQYSANTGSEQNLIEQSRDRVIAVGTTADLEKAFENSEMATGEHAGRMFNQQEYDDSSSVATLQSGATENLFPDKSVQDIIGQTIYIGKESFEIIGAQESVESEDLFGNSNMTNMIFIPMTAVEKISASINITQIVVIVKNVDNVDTIKEDIRQSLLQAHEGVEDFSITTQEEILDMFDQVLGVITAMLGGIAAISLLVGGIGVMNIMLVSVTERTREIGLRKAIGASGSDILVQFLVEAMFLTFLGGTIGVGLAFLGAGIMEVQFGLSPEINLQSVLLAYAFTALVGIFFGVAPAIRASRLDPIDALRYE